MRTRSRIPSLGGLGQGKIKFGLITDLHYPRDREEDQQITGHSSDKLNEFVDRMNEESGLSFVIDVGDMIDTVSGDGQSEGIEYMQEASEILRKANFRILHVLGNHDLDHNNKEDFIDNTLMDEEYYSFDLSSFHFIVLDANYTEDDDEAGYAIGNHDWQQAWINPSQREWLENDLLNTDKPSVVIVHQRLDNVGHEHHPIKNREVVRNILENSGKVVCCLQGHSHRSIHSYIGGIHYLTFVGARTFNNAYSIIELTKEKISVEGFGNEWTYEILFGRDTQDWYGPFNDPAPEI